VLRDGRNLVAYEVALADDRGQPVARASMTSVKISRSSSVDPFAGRSGDWIELALPDSGLTVPLADYAGLRPSGESALEFELSPALSNGLGILHGAAQVLVLEAAAERAAELATARRAIVRDLSLHFLAPGRTGPFCASSALLREGKHDCLVRAELVDRGQGDALLAIGWAGIALR
jgi:acyl-coenzyme A thioesterase PaaI-like protein